MKGVIYVLTIDSAHAYRRPWFGRLPSSAQAKGYLGVQIRLNPDGKGILIMEVQPDSAAVKAGLQAKDVILKIDGTEPTSLKEFIGLLDLKQPGDQVTLEIQRDGKEEK